jgi:SAM-dependent methyltransferase
VQHTDRERAEVFGSVAELYDATRPTYPPALIDDLLAGAPDPVLDVGCGTGIVSALLASRGARVLGVELDPRMARVARAKGLEVEVAAFESWDSRDRRFALLTCGQACHWVDPQAGADKAAEVLMPRGRLALFWNFATLPHALVERLNAVYADYADLGLDPSASLRGRRGEREQATMDAINAHPAFSAPSTHHYRWSRSYTSDEWVGQLATHSDHAVLEESVRTALLARARAAIDDFGGRFHVDYNVLLISAYRSASST